MLFDSRNAFRLFAAVVLLTGGMMSVAHAEHDDDDEEHMPAVKSAVWQTECGSCHVAFPPRLLPAESWRAMMSGLDKHFGSDASLDAATAAEIGTFLEKNAGRNKHMTSGKPILRITETRWFVREHDEVSAATWKNPKIKSAANCAACHTKAESGNYSERGIRIPK
jgi:nitrate/TMAO reductase-like tetraheme cytochrome c subunit